MSDLHETVGPSDLPRQYNVDRVVAMPRDPQWLYVYWEITDERRAGALAELGVSAKEMTTALYVHDATDIVDTETGRPRLDESKDYLTVEVAPSADHRYIKVDRPDRLYCVEYVAVAPDGRAVSLAASNLAATPADRVSDIRNEQWVTAAPNGKPVTGAAAREEPSQLVSDKSPGGSGSSGQGPAQTKWLEGHEKVHETLSSAGSEPADGA